jgi:MRG
MQAESRQRNPKSTASSKKGRAQGSEIGSGRGSEERHSSVPAGGRGTKRGKDNEIEKVAIPEFLTVSRRSARVQASEYWKTVLAQPSDPPTSGTIKDDETEATTPGTPFDLDQDFKTAFGSDKGGDFKRQDAPGGRSGIAEKGIRTVALRTIHGRYVDGGTFIPNITPEVISRRGFFKDGKYSSTELDAATAKSIAGARPVRRTELSEYQNEEAYKPLTPPDEAICTEEEMFEFVMDVLSRPPPPDEPEHMTVETFNSGHHWAPLIGGTSENERAQIEEEAIQMGLWSPKRQVHPQYEKARVTDPLNSARLLFFEGQDPDRKLMIAGVPKEPLHIDPPGSKTPFDALKFPDHLVKLPAKVLGKISQTDLQQLDRSTIIRFPNAALRMLPPKFLAKLKIPIPAEDDNNDNYFQEEAFYARPSVHFSVPDMVKGYLVDDWENVTKSLMLVELPSKAPVNWILDTYFHEEKGKRRLGSAEADRLVEIVEGMKTYFERMLGKTLLYKFERGQYAEV